MPVNRFAKYVQPSPQPEQEAAPKPGNRFAKYTQPATPAPSRDDIDAMIEEAAAAIPGGYDAFAAKGPDPERMQAMGYVQSPLAPAGGNGWMKAQDRGQTVEGPLTGDTSPGSNLLIDVVRGIEAPIANITGANQGGGLQNWARTATRDPMQGAVEAVDFISPVDDAARTYQAVKGTGAAAIEGDWERAGQQGLEALREGAYTAMQVGPGSMVAKGLGAPSRAAIAAPKTMVEAQRAAVQSFVPPPRVKAPRPGKAPPQVVEPAPYSAAPEPAPRRGIGGNPVVRNADRIAGGAVGATAGGVGDAFAAPGDGSGDGGMPLGAMGGAALGIFGPRAVAHAGSRGFRAAARTMRSPASRSGFDERVAARAVRKSLEAAGIRTPEEAAAALAARYGDKPATIADLSQDSLGMAAGVSRLPGKTGETARARYDDLTESRAGRLERDIGTARPDLNPATISGDVDRMVQLAREQATPAYNNLRQTYGFGTLVSPRLQQLGELEILKPHIKGVERYRDTLNATEGRVVGDFEYWDLVKRSLDDTEQALAARNQPIPYDLDSARQAIVTEMDALVPDYAAARQLGGEAPRMQEAFRQGQSLLGGRYTAEDVGRMVAGVTGQQLTATQAGVIRSMVGKTEGRAAMAALMSPGAKKKLAQVFGPDAAEAMQARFKADHAIMTNAGRVNPNVGSVTSQAQMGSGGVGPMLAAGIQAVRNPAEAALAALSKSGGYSKQQRDLMGEMLLEGATPENLQRIFRKGGSRPPAARPPPGGGGAPAPNPNALNNPPGTTSRSPAAIGSAAFSGLTTGAATYAATGDEDLALKAGIGAGIAGGYLGNKLSKGGAKPPRVAKDARYVPATNGGFFERVVIDTPDGPADIKFRTEPDAVQIYGALVPEKYRGAGVGVALYEAIAKHASAKGLPVASDGAVSPAAARVYESLRRRGYNIQIAADAKLGPEGKIVSPSGQSVYKIHPSKPPRVKAAPGAKANDNFDPGDHPIRQASIDHLVNFTRGTSSKENGYLLKATSPEEYMRRFDEGTPKADVAGPAASRRLWREAVRAAEANIDGVYRQARGLSGTSPAMENLRTIEGRNQLHGMAVNVLRRAGYDVRALVSYLDDFERNAAARMGALKDRAATSSDPAMAKWAATGQEPKSAEIVNGPWKAAPGGGQKAAPASKPPPVANGSNRARFTTTDGAAYDVRFTDSPIGTDVSFDPVSGASGPASLAKTNEVFASVEKALRDHISANGKPRYNLFGSTQRQRDLYVQMARHRKAPDGYAWNITDEGVVLERTAKPNPGGKPPPKGNGISRAVTGGVIGGIVGSAGSADAQDDLKAEIGSAEGKVSSVEQEIAALKKAKADFDKMTDMKEKQRLLNRAGLYNGDIDGDFKGLTTTAINAWDAKNAQALAKAEASLTASKAELSELRKRDAQRQMQKEQNPFADALREFGPTGSAILGSVIASVLRVRSVGKSKAAAKIVENEINDLLTSGPVKSLIKKGGAANQPRNRAVNMNQFYREGGAPDEALPFIHKPAGWKYNTKAAKPGSLFPKKALEKRDGVGSSFIRPGDVKLIGAGLIESGLVTPFVQNAERELKEAEEDLANNKDSLEAYRAVEQAKTTLAFYQGLQRLGWGVAGAGAISSAYRYKLPKPDIRGAEDEVTAIADFLKSQMPPKPPRSPRALPPSPMQPPRLAAPTNQLLLPLAPPKKPKKP